ncbi:MAG TPA: BamA/TamA family outer membrane protein [Burkholderiaceae bacterium]|nr:BamA/TamA family outer membrane protein [Burkholderiaceae bacterium]
MRSVRAALLLALVSAMLGGCAALRPATPGNASPPPQVVVVIEGATEPQRRLLATYLDIARLGQLAPGEAIDEPELRRLVAATPAQARELLATLGLVAAEVTAERVPDAVPPRVVVRVQAGGQTRVQAVALDLRGPLADAAARGDADARATIAAWRQAWPLSEREAFTNGAWRDAKNGALARLRAAGYAQATWVSTDAEIDADRGSARLALEADSGPLFRVGEIRIEGLERQHENSVRRLADFSTGAPATEARLLDYQERLQRSGLFEGVSVTLDTEGGRTLNGAISAPVTVRVRELPLQQATVGIGISANVGPRITAEHLHRRAFGLRATARNKLEWGRTRQAWEGELSSHTLPGLYRNLVGGAAERIVSDTDVVRSRRVRLGRSYDTARIERLWFVEGEGVRVEPRVAGVTTQRTTALTLNFHGAWRDVDSIVLPTDGTSVAVQTAVGRVHDATVATGSGAFSRLHLRGHWWSRLGRDWYLQARAEAGQVFAADAVGVPETQRFRAGGDDSVRGYAYRSLAPRVNGVDVGGRVVGTASIELAHPVAPSLPSVWWAVFADAGTAAAGWSDYKPVWGAGVGVRWRSPVGPLRADVAYGEAVKQWRMHLSVGIAF